MFCDHQAKKFHAVLAQISFRLPAVLATMVAEFVHESPESWAALDLEQHSSCDWPSELDSTAAGFVSSDDGELYCVGFERDTGVCVVVRLTPEGSQVVGRVDLPPSNVLAGASELDRRREAADSICVSNGRIYAGRNDGHLFASQLGAERSSAFTCVSTTMPTNGRSCMLRAHASTIFVRQNMRGRGDNVSVYTWEEAQDIWRLLFDAKAGITWFSPVSASACVCSLVSGGVQVIARGGFVIWENLSLVLVDVTFWEGLVFCGYACHPADGPLDAEYAVVDMSAHDGHVLHLPKCKLSRDHSDMVYLGVGRRVLGWCLIGGLSPDRFVWAQRFPAA